MSADSCRTDARDEVEPKYQPFRTHYFITICMSFDLKILQVSKLSGTRAMPHSCFLGATGHSVWGHPLDQAPDNVAFFVLPELQKGCMWSPGGARKLCWIRPKPLKSPERMMQKNGQQKFILL